MAELNESFEDYSVNLQTEMDDSGATGCWIEIKVQGKSYTASLQCALDTGELEASDGSTVDMDQNTLDKIEEWALDNGY